MTDYPNNFLKGVFPAFLETLKNHSMAVLTLENDHDSCSLESTISAIENKPDVFSVGLVLEGEIRVQINLQEFVVKQNDMIIALPDAKKHILNSGNSKATVKLVGLLTDSALLVTISDKFVSHFQNYFTTSFKPIWNLKEQEAIHLRQVMDQLHYYTQLPKDKPFGQELLNTALQVFLYEIAALASTYAEPLQIQSSRKKRLFLNFYVLVKRHFKHERRVSFYADKLFVTPKYLSEVTKEISGNTAGYIIDSFVIAESKDLLDSGTLSIAQIATELQFSDQSFFGKYFKRHTGLSPKKYREIPLNEKIIRNLS